MGRRGPRTNAAKRALSPDEQWAADLQERILADCHPWQRDAATDPARLISLLVGRGGTKTTTMRVRGLLKTTRIRNGLVVYCATSRQQAEELNWFKLKDACEAYGIRSTGANPDVSFSESKLTMTCHRTDARYRMFGIEDRRDAEKLRGFAGDEFDLDEVGSWDPELLEYVVDRVILPRLGERNGALVLGSTPPAVLRGPFYEATREGSDVHRPYADRRKPEFADWKGFSSHFWTLEDVVKLPNARKLYPALVANWEEALVQKARKGWGDDHPTWMREYMGRWSADNTATVFRFRPHVDGKEWNVWNPYGTNPLDGVAGLKVAIAALPKDVGEWHYAVAMDMGSRDPFACNVFAFAPRDPERRIMHVFCFERTKMYGKLIAELLLGPAGDAHNPAGVIGVIGWPDAMVIDADQPTIDELTNVYGLRAKKAEKKADYKYGAIELVNGDFWEGRIKILAGSALARQAAELQWKPDDYGIPREDKAQANHSTDCLIYGRKAIANLFESGVVEQEQTVSVYVDPMGLDGDADPGEHESGLVTSNEFFDSWSGG